jgi:hypothetical protein
VGGIRPTGYTGEVAEEIAELLFVIFEEGVRDQPRIFVPR